ncbi:MAG: phage baseplate assembly protein V [Xanthomonadales bacterium]|nr:phage baseplate assembly protein V [Xanthomonadales bacterium]
MKHGIPRSRSTDRRYYGVFEGIVSNVDDPENEGRVKVKYPWFNEDMESEWSPVAQFFAGSDHGSFFIPELKSLVLCCCRHGDLRKPVIIGGMYNGKDKPHSDHVRKRQIASERGHKLTMIDSKGDSAGALVLEDASGCKITLSSTGHVVIKACGALTFDAPIITFRGKGYTRVLTPNNNPV